MIKIPIEYTSREERAYLRPIPLWDIGGERNGWATDADITNSVAQFVKAYPEFMFLGIENLDFWYDRPQKWYDGTTLLDYIAKGKTKFALVLFLYGDHIKYKRHWTCIYIDTNAREIDYFDSSFFDFNNAILHTVIKLSIPLTIHYGQRFKFVKTESQIQRNEGECGIYVIDFIAARLHGESFVQYVQRDHDIDLARKKFFG